MHGLLLAAALFASPLQHNLQQIRSAYHAHQKPATHAVTAKDDASYSVLVTAYQYLAGGDYDNAISYFTQGLAMDGSPMYDYARKDLGYTYIKVGKNHLAELQFQVVMNDTPGDYQSALEYAFLAYQETDNPSKISGREVFNRIRRVADDPAARQTAQAAYDNIEANLTALIAQWSNAVAVNSTDYYSHYQYASAAEQHEDYDVAIREYTAALPGGLEIIYNDLARVLLAENRTAEAVANLQIALTMSDQYVVQTALDQLSVLGLYP
jgi:tetratricopeptide (TPR) repeat protein